MLSGDKQGSDEKVYDLGRVRKITKQLACKYPNNSTDLLLKAFVKLSDIWPLRIVFLQYVVYRKNSAMSTRGSKSKASFRDGISTCDTQQSPNTVVPAAWLKLERVALQK